MSSWLRDAVRRVVQGAILAAQAASWCSEVVGSFYLVILLSLLLFCPSHVVVESASVSAGLLWSRMALSQSAIDENHTVIARAQHSQATCNIQPTTPKAKSQKFSLAAHGAPHGDEGRACGIACKRIRKCRPRNREASGSRPARRSSVVTSKAGRGSKLSQTSVG